MLFFTLLIATGMCIHATPKHIQDLLQEADAKHPRHYPDFKYEGFSSPHEPQDPARLRRKGTGPHDVSDVIANKTLPYPMNLLWLLNIYETGHGIPRSYNDILPNGQIYWGSKTYLSVGAFDDKGNPTQLDSLIGIQERTLTRFGLNLYDASTWQIALTLWNLYDVAYVYESNILYTGTTGPAGSANGSPGGIISIRADSETYKYGENKVAGSSLKTITYPGNVTHFPEVSGKPGSPVKTGPGAFFYRIIGPSYTMVDPMTGSYGNAWKYPWPNYDKTTPWNTFGIVHFNDWKPITGENAWATMIGPLQSLGLKTHNNVTNTTCGNYLREKAKPCDWSKFELIPPPVQLAVSILPAMKALQAKAGTLYHCPWGAKIFPPDADEGANVSNENNFSAYAGLEMLLQILTNYTADSSDEMISWAKETAKRLHTGLDRWFNADSILSEKGQLKNDEQVIPQGGHYNSSGYFPVPINSVGGLATDCQTWGMTVMGRERIDGKYGMGFAYKIWQTTKKYAGYYKGETLCGVGYTDLSTLKQAIPINTIWSAEWTFGAINMLQVIGKSYKDAGEHEKGDDLLHDAQTMYNEVTQLWPEGLRFPDGSYVYANKRFFIPWGWFSNPISSLCSTAWSVLQARNCNPFAWGCGDKPPLQTPQHLLESETVWQ